MKRSLLYTCVVLLCSGCFDTVETPVDTLPTRDTIRFDSIGSSMPRSDFHAVSLHDSSVVLVGGRVYNSQGTWVPSSSVTEYSIAQRSERVLPSMLTPRAFFACTTTPSGEIVVAGGIDSNSNIVSSIELYDPVNESWKTVAHMRIPRWQFATALVSDSMWYLIGGRKDYDNSTALVSTINLNTFEVKPAPELPMDVHNAAATALGDDVYVMGGRNGGTNSKRTSTLLRLQPNLPLWVPVGDYIDSVSLPTIATVANDIVVAGGCTREEPNVSCVDKIKVLAGDDFQDDPHNVVGTVYSATAVVDTLLFIVGGINQNGVVSVASRLCKHIDGQYGHREGAVLARARGQAVVVEESGIRRVVVFGGQNDLLEPVTTVEQHVIQK